MGKIYQQLTLADRTMIQMQLEMGVKPSVIASVLNRSASTISRELRRNNWVRPKLPRGPGRPPIAGGNRAEGSEKRARGLTVELKMQRRPRPGIGLWELVC